MPAKRKLPPSNTDTTQALIAKYQVFTAEMAKSVTEIVNLEATSRQQHSLTSATYFSTYDEHAAFVKYITNTINYWRALQKYQKLIDQFLVLDEERKVLEKNIQTVRARKRLFNDAGDRINLLAELGKISEDAIKLLKNYCTYFDKIMVSFTDLYLENKDFNKAINSRLENEYELVEFLMPWLEKRQANEDAFILSAKISQITRDVKQSLTPNIP